MASGELFWPSILQKNQLCKMKVSICIPQYNRIEYLLKNLDILSKQTYQNIEIVISDDFSSDTTKETILALSSTYRFPIIYNRNEPNLGYDRNLRKSIELATGDYCFILGNDDTLFNETSIEFLVAFLKKNNLPEIGFCNYVEEQNPSIVYERAPYTGVIGSGYNIALKYYRSFSFVAGIIWKKEWFDKVNTDKFDKSIYVQIYLAMLIILKGGRLFLIKEPLVLKDIGIPGKTVNSYRDKISRKWKNFKVTDGGLPRVINVSATAVKDAGMDEKKATYKIIKDIYLITYPFWIIDYKKNNAFVAAIGLICGMFPTKIKNLSSISLFKKLLIYCCFLLSTFFALLIPVWFFDRLKPALYKAIKK